MCRSSAEPGSSFCWDPVLQGPTSPASSRSSTPGQARRDRRWVCRSRAPPPVRASHPSLQPHAPIPYPFAAFHRPRAAIHASLALSPFAFVRAGALICRFTSGLKRGLWPTWGAPRRRRFPVQHPPTPCKIRCKIPFKIRCKTCVQKIPCKIPCNQPPPPLLATASTPSVATAVRRRHRRLPSCRRLPLPPPSSPLPPMRAFVVVICILCIGVCEGLYM